MTIQSEEQSANNHVNVKEVKEEEDAILTGQHDNDAVNVEISTDENTTEEESSSSKNNSRASSSLTENKEIDKEKECLQADDGDNNNDVEIEQGNPVVNSGEQASLRRELHYLWTPSRKIVVSNSHVKTLDQAAAAASAAGEVEEESFHNHNLPPTGSGGDHTERSLSTRSDQHTHHHLPFAGAIVRGAPNGGGGGQNNTSRRDLIRKLTLVMLLLNTIIGILILLLFSHQVH